MAKITLDDVGSGISSSTKINENFTKLETALNEDILWRENPIGEANQMSLTNLDMNSNRILNLPDAISAQEPVTLGQLSGDLPSKVGNSVLLSSFYQEGDTRLSEAWDRMLEAVEDPTSSLYKATTVVLGFYPGNDSGVWPHNIPVQIPSGFTVCDGSVEWNNQDTTPVYRRQRGMFEAIGTNASSPVEVTADVARGDNELTLASTASMAVGDYVNIEFDNAADQLTGIFPILYTFAKITEVSPTTIKINTIIDWDIDRAAILAADSNATFTVTHYPAASVPNNIRVKNIKVVDTGAYVNYGTRETGNPVQPDYVIGPFYFQYCDNIQVENLYGDGLKCPLVQFREYIDCVVSDCYSYFPLAISSGEGYTVQMSRGDRGKQIRIGGYETRHVCDFTSGNDLQMRDCWDDTLDTTRVSFLLHGRYESNVNIENIRGMRMGLGAGFSGFGNWIRDAAFTNMNVVLFSGRGVIGKCLFDSCFLDNIGGSLYFEELTVNDTTMTAGDTIWRRETRLSAPIDTNGMYVVGSSRIRMMGARGFDRLVFGPSCQVQSGATSISQVEVEDVNSTILNGYHNNKSYKFIGSCERVSVAPTCYMDSPHALGNDGWFSSSAITSSKISFDISGRFHSTYSGVAVHRPCKFQIGTGSTYELGLNMQGAKFTGTYVGGGQIFNDLTLSGSMKDCYFESLSYVNYVDLGEVRRPFPPAFRAQGNYSVDDTRNYDNVDKLVTIPYSETILSASDEQTIVVTLPAAFDVNNNTHHVSPSFDGVIAAQIYSLDAWQDGTEIKVKLRSANSFNALVTGNLLLKVTCLR